jgi:type II secretory pathway pseudopilin PulG
MSSSPKTGRVVAIAASAVVLAAIVAAIAVMGSPARQRLMRLDERRVDDLNRIATTIDVYRTQHGRLPASVAELGGQPGMRIPQDPESGQPYGYEMLGATEYRLCAKFDTDTAETTDPQPWLGASWAHGAGRQCFRRRPAD